MEKYIYPEYYPQNSAESVCTSDGLYNFEKLSTREVALVIDVLKVAFSKKYPKRLRGLGLLNECYTITYKERYILMTLIIELFTNSDNPYNALAVAEAYRSKGAAYREQAIQKYEYFINKANLLQKGKVSSTFNLFNDSFIYHNLAELYEKEHNLYRALKYAELAEKHNRDFLPLYPIHISNILLKIEPVKAVQYLEGITASEKYKAQFSAFNKSLLEAKSKADRGYRYSPRKSKTTENGVEDAVYRAAKEFLQYGKYFHLWHK
ncbi:MAG: hypothetical protein E7530_02100 [Ruminococcaceae bacterium]|nr:hypothetical protein [Oscillospiraceae bacterium]